MSSQHWLLIVLLSASMFLSVRAGKLDVPAALTGGLMGFLVFAGAGFTGIALVGTFFLLGTAATSWRSSAKESSGLSEVNKGKRTKGQVLANAGVAGLMGLLAWLYPVQAQPFRLMMAASLAAATADTLSSELGNVYGRKFINIITLRKDQRGLDGVISLEGTCLGIAGAIIIGIVYSLGFGWTDHAIWIVIGGAAGNIADSVLGATAERRGLLGNNAVNFLNTLTGALVGMFLNSL